MKLNTRKINRELERFGWTRAVLAKKAGTTRQSVYNWLTLESTPRMVNVERLAKALGLDPKDLLT
jgi:transcriptional regulator with XRE-family HTH domain